MKDKIYRFFSLSSEYGFYGLLFFLPISIALVESFACLMLFGFIGRKIIKPDFKYLKFWPNIFLLLFLLFSAVSLLNSGLYFSKSLNALFGKWLQYLSICIIVQDILFDKNIFKRCVLVFLSGATLAVLSGLSQYFFGFEFLRQNKLSTKDVGTRAMTSAFAHSNGFGSYLVVEVSLLFTFLLLHKFSKLKTWFLIILLSFSILSIYCTFSRGSWIALLSAFIFLFFIGKNNFNRLMILIFLTIIIALTVIFSDKLIFVLKESGDGDRFRYWNAAWSMIKEHPFLGLGVGTFMANFSSYMPNTNISYAHNCYLQIWAETGIFSLISFLGFILLLICSSINKYIVSQNYLLLGLLTGVVGFLTHSFVDVNLYSLQLAVLFWVWVGMILAFISKY